MRGRGGIWQGDELGHGSRDGQGPGTLPCTLSGHDTSPCPGPHTPRSSTSQSPAITRGSKETGRQTGTLTHDYEHLKADAPGFYSESWNGDTKSTGTRMPEKGVNEARGCRRSVAAMSNSFVTPRTVVCPAPLSMEFSRQEYWSRLPGSFWPRDRTHAPAALQVGSLPQSHLGSPMKHVEESIECLWKDGREAWLWKAGANWWVKISTRWN